MRPAESPVAAVFRALGDDTRLRILGLLRGRAICVCEFVDLLGISQAAVSEHLRRLREAGLVRAERRGTWAFYHLAEPLPAFVREALRAIPPQGGSLPAVPACPPVRAASTGA